MYLIFFMEFLSCLITTKYNSSILYISYRKNIWGYRKICLTCISYIIKCTLSLHSQYLEDLFCTVICYVI